jgi:thiamine-phosphate pyrophosphorylase
VNRSAPFPGALRVIHVVDSAGARDGARLDALLEGGVTCLWLRDPSATGRALYEAAGGLLLRCRRLEAALLVGDRVDVAQAVGADGVQLGARAVPVRAVRPWYGGWIGVSCHDAEELAKGEAAGADHLVLSPVFGVPAKGPPLGAPRFAALAARVRRPVVALGGIDDGNAPEVVAAGAAGVAAIRSLRDAPDPREAARRLAAAVTRR